MCYRNSLDADEAHQHARDRRSVGNLSPESTRSNNTKSLGRKDEEGKKNHRLSKRSPTRHVRGMEMGSSGFHEDTFNSAFGDFVTMRRRRVARTAIEQERINKLLDKLASDVINEQASSKMPPHQVDILKNSEPNTLSNQDDITALIEGLKNELRRGQKSNYFGKYKRRPEMDSAGFHGDTFGGSFGDFDTMKRSKSVKSNANYDMYAEPYSTYWLFKRRPEMDASGFHGDTFGGSFGQFDTMKKRRPEMGAAGFHGDAFGGSFGEFDTMRKRRPEMDAAGFHGDAFGGSFGEFDTMKKRRPEMDAAGFHGDAFGGSFGEFDTMKKRRPEMDAAGFHGDAFGGSFGEFDTMKKRRPEMDAAGFHGDAFGGSFGEFDTMKKRRPEMDSSGFHGDLFSGSFGQFDTMRKRPSASHLVHSDVTKRSATPASSDVASCDCSHTLKSGKKNDSKDQCLQSCQNKL